MANATKIFLAYCSSDAHAGNRSSGPVPHAGTSNWHFRGKEIVRAVVAELVAKHGLGGAVQFVLTGGSAGGMATLNNADYVAEMVRAVAPVSVLSATAVFFLGIFLIGGEKGHGSREEEKKMPE